MQHLRKRPVAGPDAGIRVVVFDMDGVIFRRRNFWLDLHQAYGTGHEAADLMSRYLSTDYATLARRTAELWKGRRAQTLVDLVSTREYSPQAATAVDELHAMGIATVIVSSGPILLALRAQRELGLTQVHANELGIRWRRLNGRTRVHVPDGDKARVAMDAIMSLGFQAEHAACVGDTDSDVPLARVLSLAVAYNSDSTQLSEVASHHLPADSLGELPTIVRSFA